MRFVFNQVGFLIFAAGITTLLAAGCRPVASKASCEELLTSVAENLWSGDEQISAKGEAALKDIVTRYDECRMEVQTRLTNSANDDLTYAAAFIAGEARDASAVEKLIKLANSAGGEDQVSRIEAVRALGKIGSKEARDGLASLVTIRMWPIGSAAADTLLQLDEAMAIQSISQVLQKVKSGAAEFKIGEAKRLATHLRKRASPERGKLALRIEAMER